MCQQKHLPGHHISGHTGAKKNTLWSLQNRLIAKLRFPAKSEKKRKKKIERERVSRIGNIHNLQSLEV